MLSQLEGCLFIRVKNHLNNTGTVTKVDKNNTAMITPAIDPAA
jgi:hypothetical protein